MRIGSILILIIVLVGLLVGQAQYESGEEDIRNITDTLVWNYTSNIDSDVVELDRLGNIIDKSIDWAGFSLIELTKGTVEYGYIHHNFNYEVLLTLIKWFLYVWIFTALISQLPYIIAIIYIIWVAIVKGSKLIYNIIKNRRREN